MSAVKPIQLDIQARIDKSSIKKDAASIQNIITREIDENTLSLKIQAGDIADLDKIVDKIAASKEDAIAIKKLLLRRIFRERIEQKV